MLNSRGGWTAAEVNLAWTLATWEHAGPADIAEAIRLAVRACARSQRPDAHTLDALGAAYAAAGRFDDALGAAEEARALADSSGQTELARDIERRLQLYRAGRAFRRPTPWPRP